MTTVLTNFPSKIIDENEKAYIQQMEAIVSSLDHYASMQVTKRMEGLMVRITPSEYGFFLVILQEIKKIHRALGIVLEFSKSMKLANNICYSFSFE